MALEDFPIYQYPTTGFTNGGTLYESLGSFWTQLFNERDTIKGYTLAQAEELIQSYLNLVETIKSYSVHDIPVFHRKRWYPVRIKKSEYNNVTQLFRSSNDPEYAVFGPQKGTPTDKYYEDVTFVFGYPKTPIADVYGIDLPEELRNFSILANKILNPSLVLSSEVDFRINSDVCYFNRDIFTLDSVAKYNVFDDEGKQVYYTDKQGQKQAEQEIILWAYNADIDTDLLYKNFGYIFEMNMDNDVFFKEVLKSAVNLFVDGPTVQSVRALACAFLGVVPVIEKTEVIEDSYVTGNTRFIITDKNVYRCDKYYTLLKQYRQTASDPNTIRKGTVVTAGDVMVDAAEYHDYVQSGDWWRNGLVPKVAYDSNGQITRYPEMSFPPHLFVGTNKFHFTFKNTLEIITRDTNGMMKFPVVGDPTDVAAFHSYINDSSRRNTIANTLGLAVGGTVAINPLEFIFQNFFKHSTALIKLNLADVHQAYVFTTFFSVIKDIFPKHAYLMFYLDFSLTNESMQLNENTTVLLNGASSPANSDGSSSATATFGQMLPESTPNYKGDIKTRYFCLSKGIDLTTMNSGNGTYSNIDDYAGSDLLSQDSVQGNTFSNTVAPSGDGIAYKDGALTVPIPVGSTTRDFHTISLLTFS